MSYQTSDQRGIDNEVGARSSTRNRLSGKEILARFPMFDRHGGKEGRVGAQGTLGMHASSGGPTFP